ncbi:hypothetical protein CC86DRAFT_411033 [Ophiobolus disseminans]|uniref:F-box domain-containing protein n=1 Tax=Ophiobolus disseminans TaxID=1469910 RepID=A0A6A6ZK58_9PLEO|nr:hypothetical protein CC86DRAFT_411033 [Ophiobolus disseminans]
MTTPANYSLTPPLLSLPSEIRSKIYNLIADFINEQGYVLLIPPDRALLKAIPAPRNTQNWYTFTRSYLGLTQTCRTLRDEFLPIWDASFKAALRVRDLDAYLTNIIARGSQSPCQKKLYICEKGAHCMQENGTHTFDAHPLLMLALAAWPKNVDVEIDPKISSVLRLSSAALENRDLATFLTQCVSQVLVTIERDEVSMKIFGLLEGICLEVNPECTKGWMWVKEVGPDRRYKKKKQNAKRMMGLENKDYVETFKTWKDNMGLKGIDDVWVVSDKTLADGPLW